MKKKELKALLNSMTIEEKIGQLIQLSGEFYNSTDISMGPRQKLGITQKTIDLSGSVLNVTGAEKTHKIQHDYMVKNKHAIPLLFMADIVYGYKTVYPIPLGIGATWDPKLIEQAYSNTAEEAYSGGTQVGFAPMVDLVHDPRWGRVLESTGEDSYLNSKFASAMVRGFQSKLSDGKGIASCIKHFAAYGAAEAGREYNSSDMSLSNFYQNYLPSYHAAVKAGVKMVMTSLNTLNGVPATADKWLLQDILRDKWHFTGIIISDYASIYELIKHGFASDENDAALKALNAGVDIDMKSPCYANGLKPLLDNGHLSEEKIDRAVWKVLSLKNELGLFEDPYRGASKELEKKCILTNSKLKVARKVSQEALVLLKNDHNILPLNKDDHKKIALIGPYANEKELLGLWAVHGNRDDTVTIAEGIKKYKKITVAKGTDIIRDYNFLINAGMPAKLTKSVISIVEVERKNNAKALDLAQKADVIVFACGEHTLQSGEAGSRTKLRLPDNQMKLLNNLAKLNKPIVAIVISGRPLVLTDVAKKTDAILQAWFPGTEGGNAIADVLFGKYNPSGRLSMSMPYCEGQLPLYYNHLSTGRPQNGSQHTGRFVSRYTDAPTGPLYPFGYGLSYGKVKYHEINLVKSTISKNEKLMASINIENIGKFDRNETVQVYFHDKVASIVQPVKRLIDFKKVKISAGEKVKVNFQIDPQKLGFYDNNGNYLIEPGKFELYIGSNSENCKQCEFQLKE